MGQIEVGMGSLGRIMIPKEIFLPPGVIREGFRYDGAFRFRP